LEVPPAHTAPPPRTPASMQCSSGSHIIADAKLESAPKWRSSPLARGRGELALLAHHPMCTVCKSPSTLRLRRVAAAHASQVTVDRCALRRTVERAAHRPMPLLQIAGAGWAGYPCHTPNSRVRVDGSSLRSASGPLRRASLVCRVAGVMIASLSRVSVRFPPDVCCRRSMGARRLRLLRRRR
jgi:hypothetical protein